MTDLLGNHEPGDEFDAAGVAAGAKARPRLLIVDLEAGQLIAVRVEAVARLRSVGIVLAAISRLLTAAGVGGRQLLVLNQNESVGFAGLTSSVPRWSVLLDECIFR